MDGTAVLVFMLLLLSVSLVGTAMAYNAADVKPDGKIDIFDLASVGLAYGTTPESDGWNPRADANGDGIIGMADLKIVGDGFGK